MRFENKTGKDIEFRESKISEGKNAKWRIIKEEEIVNLEEKLGKRLGLTPVKKKKWFLFILIMKFINKTKEVIYIPKEQVFIQPNAIILLEKKIGFKAGLTPYKHKLQKKYDNIKEN